MADIVVVATGRHASNFKHHSMEVHLSSHWDSDVGLHLPYEQLIIVGDDVPHLCNILPGVYLGRLERWGHEDWISNNVCIQINIKRNAGVENDIAGPNYDSPLVKRLLEPFCRLYGMRVRVRGHVTPSYKESIEQCAARQAPTAKELVSMVFKDREEGNEAFQDGNLSTALIKYELALDLLRSGYSRLTICSVTVETPELPSTEVRTAMDILQINLKCLIASAYLRLGEYTKCYRCAQDLGLTDWHVDSSSNAHFLGGPDCARILFCKALAGNALGQPVQALIDLSLGLNFAMDNNEALKKKRKVLRGLMQNEMDVDLHMILACALDRPIEKSKKAQRSGLTPSMAQWRDLDALIDKEFFRGGRRGRNQDRDSQLLGY